MPTTSNYGFPYQGVDDAPDGPALGEDLATAIDTQLKVTDDAVAALGKGVIYCESGGSGSNVGSNFAGETTLYTKTNMPLEANRAYRVWVSGAGVSGGATFPLEFALRVKNAGTQILQATAVLSASGVAARAHGERHFATGGTPGTPTFTVTAIRLAGSVNLDITDATTDPFSWGLQDIGPASILS